MSRLDLKIFLSSPGDVSDERALARTVLDRLSQEYALRDHIHIEEVSWDDPGAPVPMDAHLTHGAGLIPRLHAHSGAFAGSADWLAVRFSPAERGSDPFFSLARALPLKQRTASESPEAIAKTLFEDPTELNRLADQLLQSKPPHAKLLLFANQFEELFTARVDTRYRAPFIKLIAVIGPCAPTTTSIAHNWDN